MTRVFVICLVLFPVVFVATLVATGTLQHQIMPRVKAELDTRSGRDAGIEEAADKFSRITRPAKSHFIQTQIYLRLLEEHEGMIGEVRRAVIIYEQKADQQYKEFVVSRLDKWTDDLFETAKDIAWALDNDREIVCLSLRADP